MGHVCVAAVNVGQARSRALVVASLGTVLTLVAFTAPLATVNAVAAELDADVAGRTWMLSSMGVGLGATLLTAGALADDLGRRRLVVWGLLVLSAGSAVSALAGSTGVFVASRVVQGVGGAAVVAASLGLVAHWYEPGPARARAAGVWGASVGGGITLGPLLSTFLERWLTWRDAYWVLVVGSLAVAAHGRLRLEENRSATPRGLDLAGAALLSASLTCLLAAMVEGRQGWTSTLVLGLAGAAVVTGLGFVAVEVRSASAMVPLELFRAPRFVAATTAAFVTGAGIIAVMSYLPGFLGLALGVPATTTALVFVAWSGTSVVVALFARRLPARFTGRLQLAASLALVGVGQLALGGVGTSSSWGRLVPGLLVAGVASGVLNSALGREAVASVPDGRGAMGSGANNTARYVGSAVGVTVVSVVVATVAAQPSGAPASDGVAGLVAGWNAAVLVTAAVSLVGSVVVLLCRERG